VYHVIARIYHVRSIKRTADKVTHSRFFLDPILANITSVDKKAAGDILSTWLQTIFIVKTH